MDKKQCNKYNNILPIIKFEKYKIIDGSYNYRNTCSICRNSPYYETINKNKREKYDPNKKRVYYLENRQEIISKNNNRHIKRRKTDPLYKLADTVRSRTRCALKFRSWKKTTKFYDYIGCSLEELKIHLEKQFSENMTWDNQGKWHIDHIIPLVSAKTEEELYKLCHYTNLQPMWALDNQKKGAKIITPKVDTKNS